MLQKIEAYLDKDTHKYSFCQGINPKKIYSGSQLLEKSNIFDDKYAVYGKVATNLGTGVHNALEEVVKDYLANKDIKMLYKILDKHRSYNYMFVGILEQLLTLIEQYKTFDTEITSGLLRDDNIAFCGTADLIMDNKILVDYKTIVGKPIINSSFHAILENVFYGKENFYFLSMNKLLQEQIYSYVLQMGLYLLIFDLESVILLTPDERIDIDKEDSIKLKEYTIQYISNLN